MVPKKLYRNTLIPAFIPSTSSVNLSYKKETEKITTVLTLAILISISLILSKLSERGKHVYHKNPLKLDPRPTYNATAIRDPANPLPASTIVIQWCVDRLNLFFGLQAHRKAPCFSRLRVIIVTRVVLLPWVEIVPIDFVLWVKTSFTN